MTRTRHNGTITKAAASRITKSNLISRRYLLITNKILGSNNHDVKGKANRSQPDFADTNTKLVCVPATVWEC